MTPGPLARRIVLRLDPAQRRDGAMEIAARLAKAFDAELAARMIADTRLAGAFAVRTASAPTMEVSLRRAEVGFRQTISAIATREHAHWSFEVVHCAGVLARECAMAEDDLVAIDLPRMEFSMAELREEIAEALIEEDLHRRSGVGTTEHDREGLLGLGSVGLAPGVRGVRPLRLAKATIPLLEPGQGRRGAE